MEASISIGVRHFWHASAGLESLAMSTCPKERLFADVRAGRSAARRAHRLPQRGLRAPAGVGNVGDTRGASQPQLRSAVAQCLQLPLTPDIAAPSPSAHCALTSVMPPPAKRTRLSGADETAVSDSFAKNSAKVERKFKRILDKYSKIPDEQSDIINMRTDEVEVDNGHLRSLRQSVRKRRSAKMLDEVFVNGLATPVHNNEELEDDDRDELAPSHSPPPRHCRPPELVGSTDVPLAYTQVDLPSATEPTADPSLNATGSLEKIQFGHASFEQQAQPSVVAQLAQAAQLIQSLQQSVQQLIHSGLLPNTANLQLPQSNAPLQPVTPIIGTHDTVSATTSRLNTPLPPPVNHSTLPTSIRSSPPPCSRFDPRTPRFLAKYVYIPPIKDHQAASSIKSIIEPPHPGQLPRHTNEVFPTTNDATLQTEVNSSTSRRKPRLKYRFSDADDHRIIDLRLKNHTWDEIKSSEPKWNSWPLHVFQHRWRNRLRIESEKQVTRLTSSPLFAHHLPTPSSLEYLPMEGHRKEIERVSCEPAVRRNEGLRIEDRNSLSCTSPDDIALWEGTSGTEKCAKERLPTEKIPDPLDTQRLVNTEMENSGFVVPAGDCNLKSIETLASVEDEVITTSQNSPSPSNSKSDGLGSYVHSESDDAFGPAADSLQPVASGFICKICRQSFETRQRLQSHEQEPHPKEIHFRPRLQVTPDSDKIDRHSIDVIPCVKMEPQSPSQTLPYEIPGPQTPRGVPDPTQISTPPLTACFSKVRSSSSKEKSAFRKYSRRVWAKSARRLTSVHRFSPMRLVSDTSSQEQPRVEDNESEDELAG